MAAFEHDRDNALGAPDCPTCGRAMQLIGLERFTGWWCPACEAPDAS